jgi:hypothetical protein
MAEKKDEMGAVTHEVSQVGNDMNKHANVKEANVASVALSKSPVEEIDHIARVSADNT